MVKFYWMDENGINKIWFISSDIKVGGDFFIKFIFYIVCCCNNLIVI